jgi:hypothetical protein
MTFTSEMLALFAQLEHTPDIHQSRRLALLLDLFDEHWRSCVSVNDRGPEPPYAFSRRDDGQRCVRCGRGCWRRWSSGALRDTFGADFRCEIG